MVEEKQTEKKVKKIMGEVLSNLMDKTIVVSVERTFRHPRLHKTMKVKKKYKVHDELGQAKTGDVVEFFEGRPKSKSKYMYLDRIVRSA